MPEDIKQKCIAVFGEPPKREYVKIIDMEKFVTYNRTAVDFFSKFEFENGEKLPDSKQVEYYNNAIVLDALVKRYNEIKSIRKSIGASRTNIWTVIMNELQSLKTGKNSIGEVKYPHNLPQSECQIKRILKKYQTNGYSGLISGNIGNQNTRRLRSRWERLFLSICKRSNRPFNTWVADEYNRFVAGRI